MEVFDKKSYEAEFTEIDDGVRDRTINLVLKEDAKKGSFSDLNAGWGTNDRYIISGKLYRFTRGSQMTALGMYNNVNEFGFTAKDMEKFGSQVKGQNITGAGGLNFSFSPTAFNKYYISYLGSSTKRILDQNTEAEYFSEKASYNQLSGMNEENRNTPNSFDFGIHHRFDPKHKLIFTGNIDLVKDDLERITNSNTFTNVLTLNNLGSLNNQLSNMFRGSAKTSYMVKLNAGKTQFQTGFSISLFNHFSGSDLNNVLHIYKPDRLINTS